MTVLHRIRHTVFMQLIALLKNNKSRRHCFRPAFLFSLVYIYAFGGDVVKGPLAGLGEQMYTQE